MHRPEEPSERLVMVGNKGNGSSTAKIPFLSQRNNQKGATRLNEQLPWIVLFSMQIILTVKIGRTGLMAGALILLK